MSWLSLPAECLLELVYPHHCVLCGCMDGLAPFFPRGLADSGLRPWDRPHLCRHCYDGMAEHSPTIVDGAEIFGASARTYPDLVQVVSQWKYHGIRGLGWPLSSIFVPTVRALQSLERVDALMPIPLHALRRRGRGFNQAGMLARLAGLNLEIPVLQNVLIRQRNTRQQAQIQGHSLRQENIQEAFKVSDDACWRSLRIGLVDDLITTGATAVSAAQALGEAGFDVRWTAALGIASQKSMEQGADQVDR